MKLVFKDPSTGKLIVDFTKVFYYLAIADEIRLNEDYSPDILNSLVFFIQRVCSCGL